MQIIKFVAMITHFWGVLATKLIHSKERWMDDKMIPERIVTSGAKRALAMTLLAIDMVTKLASKSAIGASATSKVLLVVLKETKEEAVSNMKCEGYQSSTFR